MGRRLTIHANNPGQLDRFSLAGAKDDRADAQVLADAPRADPNCLRRLVPAEPVIIELPELSRIAEDLPRVLVHALCNSSDLLSLAKVSSLRLKSVE